MARICGKRIVLREYTQDDFAAIRKWVNDPDVTKNLSDSFLYPHSTTTTQSFLDNMLEAKGDSKGFVIADKETEEFIGQIDLIKIDWRSRVALLGIVIGESRHQGKGYGAEAIKLIQEFVFNQMNLNRLELTLHDYNEKAYKCYLKCGFKEEGRKRQDYFIDGRYTDTIFMGILKSEYEELKQSQQTEK